MGDSGIITIQENRENLNAMHEWRREEIAKMHEKCEGKLTEEKIDKIVDTVEVVLGVVSTGATVAVKVWPGATGKAVAAGIALASTGLLALTEPSREFLKATFVKKDPKSIIAAMTNVSKATSNISITDKDIARVTGLPPLETVITK